MADVDKRITDFIRKHHIFTLATAANNLPYACTCFYVYEPVENRFVFTSDTTTRHGGEMLGNPYVSGAIALETTIVGKIQGIQFTGRAYLLKGDEYEKARKEYIRKFPVSALMNLTLWAIDIDFIKMTHNQLGFGKKLIWETEK